MQDAHRFLKRRAVCRTLAGALIAPLAGSAQTSKVRRIGVLDPASPDVPEWYWKEAAPLRALGWVEGENLLVDRRYAEGRPQAQQALAEELVRAKVELIVADDSATALAAKRATDSVPIIVYSSGDPVLVGLVASLARPGANVTGIALATAEVTAKELSLLKKMLPGLQRIGYLYDAGNLFDRANRPRVERLCRSLGLAPKMIAFDAGAEMSPVFQQLVEWRAQALVVRGNLWERRFEIVEGATKLGLATMAAEGDMVREVGALMAYTWSWAELFRLRAKFIDRILRGAKAADLPVEQPTVFELVINLRTARALGIAVPKELLLQANEVVE